MAFDIEAALERLLAREGGYVDIADDPGGKTNFGITERTARAYGYQGDMRWLPLAVAHGIYRMEYWVKPGFSSVATMSGKIAEELFDTGVNMGPMVAATFLQRWLTALNRQGQDYADLKVDGNIGPATLRALASYLKLRGDEGEAVMVKGLNCSQGARYLELAEKREKSETFLFGWIAGRIS